LSQNFYQNIVLISKNHPYFSHDVYVAFVADVITAACLSVPAKMSYWASLHYVLSCAVYCKCPCLCVCGSASLQPARSICVASGRFFIRFYILFRCDKFDSISQGNITVNPEVALPSSIPLTIEAKLSSSRITSAACLLTSDPLPIAIPAYSRTTTRFVSIGTANQQLYFEDLRARTKCWHTVLLPFLSPVNSRIKMHRSWK